MVLEEMVDYIKIIAYAWALFEIGLLAHLYYFAQKKSKSKIMRAVFIFYTVFGLTIFYRFIFNYSVMLTSHHYDLFKNLIIIFLIAEALSARYLRTVSTKEDTCKLNKEIKKHTRDVI